MFVKYTVHGWYGVYRGCVFLALVENGNVSFAVIISINNWLQGFFLHPFDQRNGMPSTL